MVDARTMTRLAYVIVGTALVFNAAFFALSYLWSADHKDADLLSIRAAFLILTVLVAAATFGAAVAPRATGHLLALLTGIAALTGGIAALATGMPGVLAVTLVIIGAITPLLAYHSYRHSRAAWSVVVSILAVLSAVTFFGAPKVRSVLHIGIWSALIAPGLMIVGVVALARMRRDEPERA